MFWILLFFVGGGWLIGKSIGNVFFPKSDFDEDFSSSNSKDSPIIINNYTTENHLHVSEKFLKESNK